LRRRTRAFARRSRSPKNDGVPREEPKVKRFAFIRVNREKYRVAKIREVFEISVSQAMRLRRILRMFKNNMFYNKKLQGLSIGDFMNISDNYL